MSAFVVSKKHIDHMASVALEGPANSCRRDWSRPRLRSSVGIGTIDCSHISPDELGQILVDENLRSIHARYPDTVTNPEGTPGPCARYWETAYKYQAPNPLKRLNAVTALKAINCYQYQACESDDWETTRAYAFCQDLKESLIRALPGYDDAPWGVDD